MLGRY